MIYANLRLLLEVESFHYVKSSEHILFKLSFPNEIL